MIPETPEPGQESVWAYPRPAIAEACDRHLKIVHRGIILAETRKAVRTLEISHPPSNYFLRDDVAMDVLEQSTRSSVCEWKGRASYFHVRMNDEILQDAGWSYATPTPSFLMLENYIAFYPGVFEACFVDGEKVVPQAGHFYGGWITSHVSGPFKGVAGSMFW